MGARHLESEEMKRMDNCKLKISATCYDPELIRDLLSEVNKHNGTIKIDNEKDRHGIVDQVNNISVGTDLSILFSLLAGALAFLKTVRPILIELIKRNREIKIKNGDVEILVKNPKDLGACIEALEELGSVNFQKNIQMK